MKAATHPRQEDRLRALHRYEILDTPREEEFDDIVRLMAQICDVPVAVINFIDADRQWFKAEVGLGVRSTPLDTSLCSHVILEREFVEINDTLKDARMSDNPLCVADGGFRFYAGAVLESDEGLPLGTLCVLDNEPRRLTELQRHALRTLARRVMRELDLRHALKVQDLLAREVDHRVKNSLASIGAIIQLQLRRTRNEEARTALEAVLSRLAALSALHEEMHSGTQTGQVDVAKLIDRTVDKIRMLVADDVQFELLCETIDLPAEHATSVALIVNEFVANAVKHGFAGRDNGTVSISVRRTDDGYELLCRDDGCGDRAVIERIADSEGLGTRVISVLASSIGSEAEWEAAEPGVRLTVRVTLEQEPRAPAESGESTVELEPVEA